MLFEVTSAVCLGYVGNVALIFFVTDNQHRLPQQMSSTACFYLSVSLGKHGGDSYGKQIPLDLHWIQYHTKLLEPRVFGSRTKSDLVIDIS